jgi:hypothetical protein
MSMLELRRLSNLCGQGAQRAVAAVMRAQRTANEPTLSPLILSDMSGRPLGGYALSVVGAVWVGEGFSSAKFRLDFRSRPLQRPGDRRRR